MDLTLLEIRLPDLPIPVPPGGTTAEPDVDEGASGRTGNRQLLAFAVVVGLALLARALRRSAADGSMSEDGER